MSVANHSRLLYCYVPLIELPGVLSSQCLGVVNVALRSRWIRRCPDVVWLNDLLDPAPAPSDDAALVRPGLSSFSEDLARVAVAVPDAQHWQHWAKRHVATRVVRELDDAPGALTGHWWVVGRPIPAAAWVRIESLRTGAQIWPPIQPASAPDLRPNSDAAR